MKSRRRGSRSCAGKNKPMYRGKKALLIMSVAGMLAAGSDEQVSSTSHYVCPGNLAIDVTFRGGKQVEIDLDGEVITLPRVKSESGAKYESDDGQIFWSMGKDAQFSEKPGVAPISCQRR